MKQRAESLKARRISATKCIQIIWKEEDGNKNVVTGDGDKNTNKEMELAKTAEKLELKRKMIGRWLAKCKSEKSFN